MAKVIYEKRFPKKDVDELFESLEASAELQDELMPPSFQDMMNKLNRNTVYVLMPEREASAQQFLRTAIDVSSTYQLDIKVEEHRSHITVYYYFNSSGCMGFLRRVLEYADDLAFFTNIKGYDIVMAIDYYTHAVYRRGRKVNP